MSDIKPQGDLQPKLIPEDEFHLGVTMAGAVSAGSYTGGVMDYLFEALDLWERAKKGELAGVEPDMVPKHKVVIDAMGGASAGGMTTAMAALHALNGSIKPVTDPDADRMAERKGNIFYDSWVLLDDLNVSDKRKTFLKLWDTDDLKQGVIRSALNSKAIDSIADHAFTSEGDHHERIEQLPTYIAKDLELLISHTLLRGIPLTVPFYRPTGLEHSSEPRTEADPGHTSFDHYLVAHYSLKHDASTDKSRYLPLNPYSEQGRTYLKLSAKATGAFPVGLMYRKFPEGHFSKAYLNAIVRRVLFRHFGQESPAPEQPFELNNLADPFSSITVDGGAMNNEPYAEVLSILRDRYGATTKADRDAVENGSHPNTEPRFGVIMIDPFPDRAKEAHVYKEPKDLFDVAPQLIGTLWDQSKVKRNEMIEQFRVDHYRGQVHPVKRRSPLKDDIDPHPIACGSVAAFGGFLDMRFRHHDFFLGRNNARNFIRRYLSLPYQEGSPHPLHRKWSQALIEKFKVDIDGRTYLPIIPDMNILLNKLDQTDDERYKYDVPQKPKFDPRELIATIPLIENRVERLMVVASKRAAGADTEASGRDDQDLRIGEERPTDAAIWMRRLYRNNLWKRVKGWAGGVFVGLIFSAAKGTAAKRVTKVLVAWILESLEEHGVLKAPGGGPPPEAPVASQA